MIASGNASRVTPGPVFRDQQPANSSQHQSCSDSGSKDLMHSFAGNRLALAFTSLQLLDINEVRFVFQCGDVGSFPRLNLSENAQSRALLQETNQWSTLSPSRNDESFREISLKVQCSRVVLSFSRSSPGPRWPCPASQSFLPGIHVESVLLEVSRSTARYATAAAVAVYQYYSTFSSFVIHS